MDLAFRLAIARAPLGMCPSITVQEASSANSAQSGTTRTTMAAASVGSEQGSEG